MRPDEPLECGLVPSGQEAVVITLEIEPAEPPKGGALDRPQPEG